MIRMTLKGDYNGVAYAGGGRITGSVKYFKAHPDKFPKAPVELRLSVIQIPVEADSGRSARALTKIQAIRKRIVGGEKFAKVAQETSDDTESAA